MKQFQNIYQLQHKLIRHPAHLSLWQAGKIPPPISVELDPTNECNNSCIYCRFRSFHKKRDSLTISQMTSYIQQLVEVDTLSIQFSGGGEPLMNSTTEDAVAYARAKDLDVGFITNGQLITPQIAEILVSSCTWVRISLSATTPETFEAIRGVDKLDDAIKGINNLCQAQKTLRSQCTLGVQWIYTKREPVKYLINFLYKHLKGIGLDYLQLIPEQTFRIQHLINQRDLPEIIEKLKITSPSNPQIIYSKADDLLLPNFGRNYETCEGHWFTGMIAANGKMYICCHLLGIDDFEIGDLNKQPFADIWYGKKRREVAKRIDVSKCLHICKHHENNKFLHSLKQPMPHENFI